MRLYVYCLAEGVERLNKTPPGVSGAPVRIVEFDEDLSALVSVSRFEAFQVNRKNALAHHEVVRSITEQTTPLPARFGTVVTIEQLRNYVSTHHEAIKAKLAHVRGGVEMNVRMIHSIDSADTSQESKNVGPGTAFLLEKRRELVRDEAGATQKGQLSEWLRDKLGDLIKEEKISITPSETVILARADHLIERVHVQEYRAKMAKAVEERPEIRFMVSGPWPPYSFANIELEFSRQFGVS
ncbi:MAG TPA: GvpL/GvpF family gas vesicle protein [Pyrinomonadaceae bacterium]|nr:GvpL/GvpF family gas vesicle protein [Pyrinomonadaceae bacterium]